MSSKATRRPLRKLRTDGTIEEVDHYIRRSNPHLRSGHRLHHDSFSDIIGSLFSLHNETVNVWSHFVPAFLFVHLLTQVYYDVDKLREDRLIFCLYVGSCCLLCSFSSIYHLFSAHSEKVHNLVVKFDFLGIIFVIASSFVMSIWYGFHCQPQVRNFYLLLYGVIDVLMLATPFMKLELFYRRAIFFGSVCCGIPPLVHLASLYGDSEGATSVFLHVSVILALYFLGFVFYVSKFPERFFPHKFDLVGASHQIWHFFVLAAFVYYYIAMESIHMTVRYAVCDA